MKLLKISTIAFLTMTLVACGTSDKPDYEVTVPACDELMADLGEKYPEQTKDEIVKAAADILYSDEQNEAAELCCAQIDDEALRGQCVR